MNLARIFNLGIVNLGSANLGIVNLGSANPGIVNLGSANLEKQLKNNESRRPVAGRRLSSSGSDRPRPRYGLITLKSSSRP